MFFGEVAFTDLNAFLGENQDPLFLFDEEPAVCADLYLLPTLERTHVHNLVVEDVVCDQLALRTQIHHT